MALATPRCISIGARRPQLGTVFLHPNRVLVDAGGDNMHVGNYVDGVLGRCEVRRAVGKAPHVPIAGTSTVSISNEKLQAGLLFPGGPIASHATDVTSKYSLLIL